MQVGVPVICTSYRANDAPFHSHSKKRREKQDGVPSFGTSTDDETFPLLYMPT